MDYFCDKAGLTANDLIKIVDLICPQDVLQEKAREVLQKQYGSVEQAETYFNKHFSECNGCKEFYDLQLDLTKKLHNLPQVEPPEHLVEKIKKAAREYSKNKD